MGRVLFCFICKPLLPSNFILSKWVKIVFVIVDIFVPFFLHKNSQKGASLPEFSACFSCLFHDSFLHLPVKCSSHCPSHMASLCRWSHQLSWFNYHLCVITPSLVPQPTAWLQISPSELMPPLSRCFPVPFIQYFQTWDHHLPPRWESLSLVASQMMRFRPELPRMETWEIVKAPPSFSAPILAITKFNWFYPQIPTNECSGSNQTPNKSCLSHLLMRKSALTQPWVVSVKQDPDLAIVSKLTLLRGSHSSPLVWALPLR